MSAAPRVEWIEVGPRDGLQNWPATLPTAAKVGLITSLLDCGMARVEATSMVHPKWVPQLADAEALLEALHDRLGRLRVLVPNPHGLERAIRAGVRNVAVTVAATEEFNRRNLNRSIEATLEEIGDMVARARKDAITVDASISVVFGCPYEGTVDPGRVQELTRRLAALGIQEIALADTIGIANPSQVEDVFAAARTALPQVRWAAHFHDTRGMGLANVLVALETGVTIFEGSVGGIGGCPFAPGAAGNICSEDALFMIEAMGLQTGVDLPKLIAAARRAEQVLGSPLPGKIHAVPEPAGAARS